MTCEMLFGEPAAERPGLLPRQGHLSGRPAGSPKNTFGGAQGGTRTRTSFRTQRPQRCVSTNSTTWALRIAYNEGNHGGANEGRTRGLRIANAALSQLSYRPMNWSSVAESNRRPSAYETDALPTELTDDGRGSRIRTCAWNPWVKTRCRRPLDHSPIVKTFCGCGRTRTYTDLFVRGKVTAS